MIEKLIFGDRHSGKIDQNLKYMNLENIYSWCMVILILMGMDLILIYLECLKMNRQQ